jgi:hypothetical protein
LIQSTDSSVSIRVDNKTRYAPRGRKSVRLESKKGYDTGLFIFDIIHTPYGCGTWPALWLADTYNWPLNGEIDVLETTNRATEGNVVTLHTDKGCSVKGSRKQLGSPQYSTCDDRHGNAGCAVQARPATYGEEFNENGGGVWSRPLPFKVKNADPSSRYTPSNCRKKESESGFSLATPSQTTSRIRNAGLTRPLGGRLWLTSPAHTATSPLTLATRASSSTLICAARWAPNRRTTRICTIVQQHVRSLSLATRRISRRLIGNFAVFGSIRRSEGGF